MNVCSAGQLQAKPDPAVSHPPPLTPGTQVRQPPGRAGQAPGRDLPVVAQVQPEAPLTRWWTHSPHQLPSGAQPAASWFWGGRVPTMPPRSIAVTQRPGTSHLFLCCIDSG